MIRCSVVTTGYLHTDHIAGIEGLQGHVTVDRRCADLAELVAVARIARADAALVIGGTESLTRTLLSELRALGITVVAVSEAAAERRRLTGLGVAALPDEVSPEELVAALDRPVDAVDAVDVPPPPPEEAPPEGELTHLGHRGGPSPRAAGDQRRRARRRRRTQDHQDPQHRREGSGQEPLGTPEAPQGVTVIWGSHGSPGRTTAAVNLAAELSAAGASVLLIDADTTASSVAAHLGLLEESAGLAQACRHADLGRLDEARLRRTVTSIEVAEGRLHLLTGLPRADRWPELRESGLRQVLRMGRELYQHVVVDTSASVEQDEELTYDTQAPRRHAATLCTLAEADRLILVGAADAVGFSRTVRAMEELPAQAPTAPVPELVLNKVRAAAVGRSPEDQLREAWARFGTGPARPSFLPWDQEACDAALLQGRALAEAAPDSALRRAAAALAGVELPQRRRLLRRRTRPRRSRSPHRAQRVR